jgi:hypothetical protein
MDHRGCKPPDASHKAIGNSSKGNRDQRHRWKKYQVLLFSGTVPLHFIQLHSRKPKPRESKKLSEVTQSGCSRDSIKKTTCIPSDVLTPASPVCVLSCLSGLSASNHSLPMTGGFPRFKFREYELS